MDPDATQSTNDLSLRCYDVLILGGGFAGVAAAKALAKRRELTTGLIADQNVMLFHPMLAEVCGASLSPRHIVNPIRNLCPRADVLLARVTDVDFTSRTVTALSGPENRPHSFRYGHLLLALGGVVDLSRVPGMGEHALPIKTVGDAFRIRSAVIDRLEEAHLAATAEERREQLRFAVVGGGYSGVETAGQIADLLHASERIFPWLRETPASITLIHSGPFLLPQIGEKLGRFAEKKLRRRGVDIILNQRVTAVTSRSLHLTGRTLDVRTIVTTVGNAAHPLVLHLEKKRGLPMEKGRIVTTPELRVPGLENVWAIGDCALIRLPDGSPAPATAQFAQRQGKLAAVNIGRLADGLPLKPFTFSGLGELASIGHHNAVAKIGGLTFSGFFAWWMWRTIYLTKLPTLERKFRVMMDWTLDIVFPRDLSLLRTNTTPRLATMHLEAGDPVYSSGDPAVNFYILQRGGVEMRDQEGTLKTLQPGDHFGERELLEGKPRQLTAIATLPSDLLILPREVFGSLSLASPGFLSRLQASSVQYASRGEVEELLSRVPESIRRQKVEARMKTGIVSIPHDASIAKVLELFKAHSYTRFPVVDAGNKLLGLIRREHLLDLLQRMNVRADDPFPPGAMEPAETLSGEESIEQVVRRMIRSGNRLYFVTDAGETPVGVLSLLDAVVD